MTNEELSLNTKKALATALKNAMEKKTLSKVTVSELVAECNLNRKTFYYHFQDIYDLLKWMLEQEAIDVVKKFDFIVNTEEAIRFILNYVEENKHIINCAYDSMGHEEIKRFFYNDLFGVVYNVIEEGEKTLNVSIDSDFKEYVSTFFTEAAAGMVIDLVKRKSKWDKEIAIQNILLICRVSIPGILKAEVEREGKSDNARTKTPDEMP
ncbi:MAG: TetR/AcrR family transcriptional regulator C-terminal domain-containing protein [Eubacteriales bacterium]